MSDTIEAVARVFWNEGLPPPDKAHRWAPTQGAFVASSFVLWDDEDMHESDRELFRKKTRAAISALAEPEAISDAAIQAAKDVFHDDPDGETGADRKSTRLNSSHIQKSRMPSSA